MDISACAPAVVGPGCMRSDYCSIVARLAENCRVVRKRASCAYSALRISEVASFDKLGALKHLERSRNKRSSCWVLRPQGELVLQEEGRYATQL